MYEIVCQGYHQIDLPPEGESFTEIPSVLSTDPWCQWWRQVHHPLFCQLASDPAVWLCPECVERFKAYLVRKQDEAIEDAWQMRQKMIATVQGAIDDILERFLRERYKIEEQCVRDLQQIEENRWVKSS